MEAVIDSKYGSVNLLEDVLEVLPKQKTVIHRSAVSLCILIFKGISIIGKSVTKVMVKLFRCLKIERHIL